MLWHPTPTDYLIIVGVLVLLAAVGHWLGSPFADDTYVAPLDAHQEQQRLRGLTEIHHVKFDNLVNFPPRIR
jgi:hypothetical protein